MEMSFSNKTQNRISYIQILKKYGLNPVLRYPWAVVGDSSRVQGWKLHISSIQSEAVNLLHQVIPFFVNKGVSFKIAQDDVILGLLNEGSLGDTQVGKFITIYPLSDWESKDLANCLIKITKGYSGPIIITDLRLGDITYTRYGCFNPIVTQNRLGQHLLNIYSSNGEILNDSYSIPFSTPADVLNPFVDFALKERKSHSKKLLGPGYLALEVIKGDPKGSVFLSLDLRNQELVSIKVIKQGRKFCLSDKQGRDIRTRLQRQETLHNKLANLVPIPKVDPYFEDDGHGYLPIEYIEGKNLEEVAVSQLSNRTWGSLATSQQRRLLSYLINIVNSIEKLHQEGYVHRDLTGSNIMIGINDEVYLIDLELAHAIDDPTPPFGLGTIGFMSPNQEMRGTPQFQDDIYSLGCVMMLVLTGFDPRRILFITENDFIDQLIEVTDGAPRELISMVAGCVQRDPSARPDLKNINNILRYYVNQDIQNWTNNIDNTIFLSSLSTYTHEIKDIIKRGQRGILESALSNKESGLWLSPSINHGIQKYTKTSYEISRDANRGVAGVVYMLGRLARLGYDTKPAKKRVQQVLPWLISGNDSLPGLHFGRAGIAVALAEAISGNLIERNEEINCVIEDALTGKLDWPDITHGAAGQGLAVFYCADRLGDSSLLQLAHRCANYLMENQKADGSWEMPQGVEGMSGEILTGFAHGVSGIVYFLSEYDRRYPRSNARQAWQAGANWLIKKAIKTKNGNALEWTYSNKREIRWKWWCHGTPGIALTFLRLFEQTKDSLYSEVAAKALKVHPLDVRYQNLSQCHGISGLGEIYLEAARVLKDTEWSLRATQIANTLINLRRQSERGSISWLVEDPNSVTADLMVGSSSVLHYLLRFSIKGEKIGFPLLLDPIE